MRTITLKYFGAVAELTGKEGEELEMSRAGQTVEEICDFCKTQYPDLAELSFNVAVNRKLMKGGALFPNDELALLPPFSGG